MQAKFHLSNDFMTLAYNADVAGRPPKTAAPPFGQRLAMFRKARGLTQPQLAQQLRVSLQTIAFYERYAKNPSVNFLKQVAKVLNVSADELLDLKPVSTAKPGPPSKLERLVEQAVHLPRSQQQKVTALLEAFVAQHGNGYKQAA